MSSIHIPVMTGYVLDHFAYIEGDGRRVVVDATFGGGGHTRALLERYPGIKVLAIDLDHAALVRGEALKEMYPGRLALHQGNYREIDRFLAREGIVQADGFILDAGVSSDLIDAGDRGFSFRQDGMLDMRMDQEAELTAEWIINRYPKAELMRIFREYGEEGRAGRIADRVIEYRRKKRIESTFELAEIIYSVYGGRGKIHPATKVFQALRIEVNDELASLRAFLEKVPGYLKEGAVVQIITFHSLEDRIVKNFFRDKDRDGVLDIVTRKPLQPSRSEILANRKARSAKLRVARKAS